MRTVATAGHVDHGKSTLVLALTGTDPDRFPEERERGLTIDLGYAFCELPSGREVGFVDVPGHVRFVKNMLAGVGAVDVAMLVVAANEGWMPQSEEHLRILELLGIEHGVVVLTKADFVDDDDLELARLTVRDHLRATALADVALVTCDSRSGRGLDDVRAALDAALAQAPAPVDHGRPRLWVDRVFAAKGAGTVATGTLVGGGIAVDDEVIAGTRPARVRGIESRGQRLERAVPGSRVALNLAGVDRHALGRGDAVVRPGQWLPATVVDAEVTALPGESPPRRGRLQAYVGSGEHIVWLRLLDPAGRFARVRFERVLPLAPGDRIVLRDPGRRATIAGAQVLDVTPARAAAAPQRLAMPLGARLLRAGWVPVEQLGARTGLAPGAAIALLEAAGGQQAGEWLVAKDALAVLREQAITHVDAHHAAAPTGPGLELGSLARRLDLSVSQLRTVLDTAPDLVVTRGRVHRTSHRPVASESAAGRALLDALESAPFDPPAPPDPSLARALVEEGRAVEIDGVLFASSAFTLARQIVVEALRDRGRLTVSEIRDLLGSTRKYVIPLVTQLDRDGVTRRRGDVRVAGPTSGLAGIDPVDQ